MSDRYARFISEEVLPAVLSDAAIREFYPTLSFSPDPSRCLPAGLLWTSAHCTSLQEGNVRLQLWGCCGADDGLVQARPLPQGALHMQVLPVR